jgi:predicted acyl esterase
LVHIAGDPRRPSSARRRRLRAFPKYDRNLNTGGDNERDTRYVVARQRILHDRAHPSFVRLPIIPR